MVVLLLVPLLIVAALILYRYLVRKPAIHALWKSSLAIGTIVGTSRAALACVGWYCVEHTGGPLQIPGFALAMLAWPEAIVLNTRRFGPTPFHVYAMLAGMLILSTVLLISGFTLVVQMTRRDDA
jgi:hypothetical protein